MKIQVLHVEIGIGLNWNFKVESWSINEIYRNQVIKFIWNITLKYTWNLSNLNLYLKHGLKEILNLII